MARRRSQRPAWLTPALGVAAVIVVLVAVAWMFGSSDDLSSGEATTTTELAGPGRPMRLGFVMERTAYAGGQRGVDMQIEALSMELRYCAETIDVSCDLVVYLASEDSTSGLIIPVGEKFRAIGSVFFRLDPPNRARLSTDKLKKARRARAEAYLEAVRTQLDEPIHQGCTTPLPAVNVALGDLKGGAEAHLTVLASGMWNCGPAKPNIDVTGHADAAVALADAKAVVPDGAGTGVTFHFAMFGRTFLEKWKVMPHDQRQWLEELWTQLVADWGGKLAGTPTGSLRFP